MCRRRRQAASAASRSAARARTARAIGLSDLIAGGGGARPELDGIEAIDTDVSNCMNVPAEAIEMSYPLRVLHYRLRRDGGGPGRMRGGTGIDRALTATAGEIVASYRSERHYTSPVGPVRRTRRAALGDPSAPRRRNDEDVPSKARLLRSTQATSCVCLREVEADMAIRSSGRRHAVLADVLDEKISLEAAREALWRRDRRRAVDEPATRACAPHRKLVRRLL